MPTTSGQYTRYTSDKVVEGDEENKFPQGMALSLCQLEGIPAKFAGREVENLHGRSGLARLHRRSPGNERSGA